MQTGAGSLLHAVVNRYSRAENLQIQQAAPFNDNVLALLLLRHPKELGLYAMAIADCPAAFSVLCTCEHVYSSHHINPNPSRSG